MRIFNKEISVFDSVLKLHSLLTLPAMTMREIKIYKSILNLLYRGNALEIFEYGSGFSTIYFARYLKKKGIKFHIDSIDNNIKWHEIVKSKIEKGLRDSVSLHVRSFKPFWEKSQWNWDIPVKCGDFAPKENEEFEYINMPLSLGKKFDLIVVDARFRRRCIENVKQCLKPNGIVFLHDAQKEHYQAPTSQYKHSYFMDSGHYFPFEQRKWQVWVGSPDNDELGNIVRSF